MFAASSGVDCCLSSEKGWAQHCWRRVGTALLNMGVMLHEGQVLAFGGRHYWKVGRRGL
jgi:hypothetical protein